VALKSIATLANFARILESMGSDESAAPQDVLSLVFRNEKDKRPSFSFERRENFPFSENRYYSRAAFGTKQHLQLVEQFERILT
jgi:hypothetical protein